MDAYQEQFETIAESSVELNDDGTFKEARVGRSPQLAARDC